MSLDTVTLADALKLMSLPRVVGTDAEGVEITAQNGRYGPYLKKGTDSRSLETEDQLFTITLDEALAIYAQPKQRGRAAAKPPLKELGTDPVSEKPVVVKDGRFGPYVTDGETNATLRTGRRASRTITPERGYELLAEKRAKGPAKKTAKKAPAKKAPAKKARGQEDRRAKKTAAKKTRGRRRPRRRRRRRRRRRPPTTAEATAPTAAGRGRVRPAGLTDGRSPAATGRRPHAVRTSDRRPAPPGVGAVRPAGATSGCRSRSG